MENDDKDLACYCNRVEWGAVDHAVEQGARTLNDLYDRCGAGTGPCGGSCRNNLLRRLDSVLPSPAKGETPAPPALVRGVSLFNRRYYWETHEVLEAVWMDEFGPDRLFYQGLIQAAASLYHVLNANPKGVIKLAEDSCAKLRPYLPSRYGIPLEGLIRTLELYAQQAREILGGTGSGFDYDRLPVLTIGVEMKR